jgi:hypothetical protein
LFQLTFYQRLEGGTSYFPVDSKATIIVSLSSHSTHSLLSSLFISRTVPFLSFIKAAFATISKEIPVIFFSSYYLLTSDIFLGWNFADGWGWHWPYFYVCCLSAEEIRPLVEVSLLVVPSDMNQSLANKYALLSRWLSWLHPQYLKR